MAKYFFTTAYFHKLVLMASNKSAVSTEHDGQPWIYGGGGGGGGGGGVATQKKPKKTSPKFEICGSVRFMSTMRSWEAKNYRITYLMPIKPCKCPIKAIISKKNHLTRSR